MVKVYDTDFNIFDPSTIVALQLYIQHQNQKQNSEEIFWTAGTAYTEQYI